MPDVTVPEVFAYEAGQDTAMDEILARLTAERAAIAAEGGGYDQRAVEIADRMIAAAKGEGQ